MKNCWIVTMTLSQATIVFFRHSDVVTFVREHPSDDFSIRCAKYQGPPIE